MHPHFVQIPSLLCSQSLQISVRSLINCSDAIASLNIFTPNDGAECENRTRLTSLEGWDTTNMPTLL
jgi:hypothetical protein